MCTLDGCVFIFIVYTGEKFAMKFSVVLGRRGGGFESTSAPQRIDDIAVKIFASGLSTTSMMYTYMYVCACIALVSHFVAVANYM